MKGNFLIKTIKLKLTAFITPALRSMDQLSIAIIMLCTKVPQTQWFKTVSMFSYSFVSGSAEWFHWSQLSLPVNP